MDIPTDIWYGPSTYILSTHLLHLIIYSPFINLIARHLACIYQNPLKNRIKGGNIFKDPFSRCRRRLISFKHGGLHSTRKKCTYNLYWLRFIMNDRIRVFLRAGSGQSPHPLPDPQLCTDWAVFGLYIDDRNQPARINQGYEGMPYAMPMYVQEVLVVLVLPVAI